MKLNWQIAPYDGMLELWFNFKNRRYSYMIFQYNDKFKLHKDNFLIENRPKDYSDHRHSEEFFDYLLDAMNVAQEDFDSLMAIEEK
jgi:hypothetical protein